MPDDPPIEGTAVDVGAPAPDPPAPPPPGGGIDFRRPSSTALAAPRTPGREVLMPMDARQVIDGMKAYQQLLHDLLDPTDWQVTDQFEDDPQNPGQKRKRRFPKKSAYRKIGRAFNLAVERVDGGVEYDTDGRTPIRAWSVMRAVAPNGQTQDGDGYCALAEFTGRRRSDPKLENTMRATATTRAKNRAIADLVGMGEVSAEELASGGDDAAPPPHPALEPASTDLVAKTARAVAFLLDPQNEDDPDQIEALIGTAMDRLAQDAGGTLMRQQARAVAIVAAVLKAALTPAAAPDPPAAPPPAEPLPQTGAPYGEPPAPDARMAAAAAARDDDVGDPPPSAQAALDTAGAPAPASTTTKED